MFYIFKSYFITVIIVAFLWSANTIDCQNTVYYPPGYLGCYGDSIPRDLYYFATGESLNMTIEQCSSLCQLQYYKYTGVQRGYTFFYIGLGSAYTMMIKKYHIFHFEKKKKIKSYIYKEIISFFKQTENCI